MCCSGGSCAVAQCRCICFRCRNCDGCGGEGLLASGFVASMSMDFTKKLRKGVLKMPKPTPIGDNGAAGDANQSPSSPPAYRPGGQTNAMLQAAGSGCTQQ